MILGMFYKQPSEVKDYTISYSDWLAGTGDSVNDATAAVICTSDQADTALVVNNVYISTTSVTVWLSGGTDRRKYKVTVQASTVGGRLDESEFFVVVRDY
jgi:hypothetical protein